MPNDVIPTIMLFVVHYDKAIFLWVISARRKLPL